MNKIVMLYYWIILIVGFFLLWLFLGRREQSQFVGLNPLFNNEPLPEDPLAINPFYLQQLKQRQQISYIDSEPMKNVCEQIISTQGPSQVGVQGTGPNKSSEQFSAKNNSTNKSKWKIQNLCCKVMEEYYQKPFESTRPTWLKNPETGGILEIDCYNDELKIGVEYNGIQHYRYPNIYHRTYQEFIKQVRRDQYKCKKCDDNGVYLITVPYNIPANKIKDYIHKHLPENVSSKSEICTTQPDYTNIPITTTYQKYLA